MIVLSKDLQIGALVPTIFDRGVGCMPLPRLRFMTCINHSRTISRAYSNLINSASSMEESAARDKALVAALRKCKDALDQAQGDNNEAETRRAEIKNLYNRCAQLLAGYTPIEMRHKPQGAISPYAKRAKTADYVGEEMPYGVAEEEIPPPPENEVMWPGYQTQAENMDTAAVEGHREAFYQKLLKISVAEIESYQPKPTNANLKSKAQLTEWIHIARHWYTGADGMDAATFRAKHKTWYSRMKPVTYKLGRKTGIHLRSLPPKEGEVEGGTVLCGYSKDGAKSVVYVDIGSIFDALFQIHSMELGHRGRDAVKTLADERYANIPDAQVRAFLDTCPICNSRRSSGVMKSNYN